MGLICTQQPTTEPVTLSELKLMLHRENDSLETETTIAPGSHAIVAAFGLVGESIDVTSSLPQVVVSAGTCSGTATIKIQASLDGSTWSNVYTFPAINSSNDEADFSYDYTGGLPYVRAVATVASAACNFSVFVNKQPLATDEDTELLNNIKAAREVAEKELGIQIITATWKLTLPHFPCHAIALPRPKLQTVTEFTYANSVGTIVPLDEDDYYVDNVSTPGQVMPAYGKSWPGSVMCFPNSVGITFRCGFGDTPSEVPEAVRKAIKVLAGELTEHPELAAGDKVGFAFRALLDCQVWSAYS